MKYQNNNEPITLLFHFEVLQAAYKSEVNAELAITMDMVFFLVKIRY